MKELFLRKDGKQDYCSQAPDVLFGVDLADCCKAHDDNWHIQESDVQLKEDIYIKFCEADKKILGWIVSRIYYCAVTKYRKWVNG